MDAAMNATRYFIGIDGGGTRTTALVTDEMGTELARVPPPSIPIK